MNYNLEKLELTWGNAEAARRGTQLHEYAQMAIRLGQKQPRSQRTMCMYVNDCIGWGLTPEQPLFYSGIAFGTPDAIGFRKNVLRISDLKTGLTRAKMTQLEIYAALFCLEYGYKPHELDAIELRIYQNNEIQFEDADPDWIAHIMDKIITFSAHIQDIREEAP
ncbi:MAG: DUF2800 domain-containing protein [bacterium]